MASENDDGDSGAGNGERVEKPEEPSELAFVTTDDLLKELMGRFDHSVFAGEFQQDDKIMQYRRSWHGIASHCTGLTSQLEFLINMDVFFPEEDGEGEEDREDED